MESFVKGYRVIPRTDLEEGPIPERVIIFSDNGEVLFKPWRTFETAIIYEDDDLRFKKIIHTSDPNYIGGVTGHSELHDLRASDILNGIRELINEIEEFKYTPK